VIEVLQGVVDMGPFFDYRPDQLEASGRVRTMVRDAAAYIHDLQCDNQKYDFVLMDAYDERDLIPEALTDPNLIDSLRKNCFDDNLDRPSWFIINLVNLDFSVFESYVRDIARRFKHLYLIQAKPLNRLLLAQTKGPIMTHLQLIQQTELQRSACPSMPLLARGRGYFAHIDPMLDPLWMRKYLDHPFPYAPTHDRKMGIFF